MQNDIHRRAVDTELETYRDAIDELSLLMKRFSDSIRIRELTREDQQAILQARYFLLKAVHALEQVIISSSTEI